MKLGGPSRKLVAHYLNLIQIAVSGIKTDAEAAWANLLKRPTVKPRDFLDLCDLLPYDKILNRGHLYTAEPDAIRSKTAPSWSLKLPSDGQMGVILH